MTTNASGDHGKIINSVAKRLLKPAGMVQKGKSRLWLDDNNWFTTILEYQPSGYEKGTFLNIGIHFNWYKQDYFSFDIGHREHEFVRFTDTESFEEHVIQITEIGLQKVIEYREIVDIEKAERLIMSAHYSSDELWGNYHRAMIHLLDGKPAEAMKYLNAILENREEFSWVLELKNRVKHLIEISGDSQKLQQHLTDLISESRESLKLPQVNT